jgi:hypothetical protein
MPLQVLQLNLYLVDVLFRELQKVAPEQDQKMNCAYQELGIPPQPFDAQQEYWAELSHVYFLYPMYWMHSLLPRRQPEQTICQMLNQGNRDQKLLEPRPCHV